MFTFDQNRSERATQVELLVPTLANLATRRRLLTSLTLGNGGPISPAESDAATVMHFVWVLRDTFYFERDAAAKAHTWDTLRKRWHGILCLDDWALEPGWWRHPAGEHQEDPNYIVHPCHRTIGWTPEGLAARIKRFGLDANNGLCIKELVEARKVMNTECDCLIQTPNRLIVIECKDQTSFSTEQKERQQCLFKCLDRLLGKPVLYAEVAQKSGEQPGWTWEQLQTITDASSTD